MAPQYFEPYMCYGSFMGYAEVMEKIAPLLEDGDSPVERRGITGQPAAEAKGKSAMEVAAAVKDVASTGLHLVGGRTILKGNMGFLEKVYAKRVGKYISSKAGVKTAKELGSISSKAKVVGKVLKAAGPVGIAIDGAQSAREVGTWTGEWVLHGFDSAAAKSMEDSPITSTVVGYVGDTPYVGAPVRWIGAGVSWLCGD
jgi:microcompartment protein CcmK/EutM